MKKKSQEPSSKNQHQRDCWDLVLGTWFLELFRFGFRAWGKCLVLFLILLVPGLARSGDERTDSSRPITLVGMRGQIDGVVLPGPELEVRPLEDSQAPFVLRIANVYPHGTAFRYDFVYYALERRTYDLTQYLRPKDGSKGAKLKPLEVEVQGLLGPGLIHPHSLASKRTSWFAGYYLLLLAGVAVWLAGLVLIVFARRAKKKKTGGDTAGTETVADRLRPLVIRAMTGMLTSSQRAELERTLLAFWRQRLGLEKEKAPEALSKMRQHPEAGILLNQLELWLHRPGTAQQVDIGKLLWPYQLTSPEEPIEAPGAESVTA
jgi:hypothetical protein